MHPHLFFPCRAAGFVQALRQRSVLVGLLLAAGALGGGVQTAWSAASTPSRIIIKWRPAETRTQAQVMAGVRTEFRQATGLTLYSRRRLDERLEVMELDQPLRGAAFEQALVQLRAQPDVEYAVPDQRRYIESLPSDPLITASGGRSGQWYLLNNADNLSPASINAVGAWDYAQGDSTIVAVVDTGVRFDHPDLGSKLLPGYDFVSCDQTSCSGTGQTFVTANDGDGWDADASDPGDWVSSADLQNHSDIFDASRCKAGSSSWHGTRVAGIIGAATNNGLGIAGTGWNTRILPIRALGKCGGYDSDIIAGMRWAAGLPVNGAPANPNPARIINLSLGGSGACSPAYADLISTLTALGVTVVASAGNDSALINTPANCSGVIGVVGVRNAGTKVGFSSLGTAATIAAPAGNCGTGSTCLYSIDTTTNLGTYDASQSCPTDANASAKCYTTPGINDYTDQTNYNLGTSFSAPIVSGTVALMLGVNSSLTPAQIIAALRSSAKPFPQTAATTCQIPTSSTVITGNEAECNCTTSTCGAGLVNALQAVLAVGGSSTSSSSSSAGSVTVTAASAPAGSGGGGGGGAARWSDLLWLAALSSCAELRRRKAGGIDNVQRCAPAMIFSASTPVIYRPAAASARSDIH